MRLFMNVYQVKDVIKRTKCVDLVYSGLYCSEPIMSKDKNGYLIDNYIVFSRNEDCSLISAPKSMFGIFTEEGQVAYINSDISANFKEQMYTEHFEDTEKMRRYRQIYIKSFPTVREMYHSEMNINKNIVSEYIDALHIISGDGLFSFYRELFPGFFEWAIGL